MVACPGCGRENTPDARFCSACGTPLDVSASARKTVTILFSDVVGSTALGERLDAEALRLVMRRYFDALRVVIERHGGTVEKFAGDAVMAVFGVPQLHEDDALRAVRAAVAMRAAGERVNDELERELHVRFESRTGVNTGEVVTGAGQTLATGDAVNVAARLEQAAPVGEILLGPETYAAVRDAVRAEFHGKLELKGKSEPVEAWRVIGLVDNVPAFTRRIYAPFVGRAEHLAQLEQALERSTADRRCELVTILGAAGIGKSRLARELVQRATQHRVLVGRCLPYGDGITFWPLGEIVRQLPPLGEILADDDEAELITLRVAGAIGAAGAGGPAGETAWAFRRLFEALARSQPLIVVVDDIHWAEPTLLDLLEYVVSLATDAPILVLCLARSELLEERPTWISPRTNATVLTLEALRDEESEDLVERLASGLDDESRTRIVEGAEGNPLFVEQLLAHQAESGDGELHVPATIHALLAARIDRLSEDERAVVECASIEGRMFHRGAVTELLPEPRRPAVGTHLMSLVRKGLVRPDSPIFPTDDGFRFGHILIRDAAYDSVPKQLRAELHERYANWLEAKAVDRTGEYEEILGYHLEQAHRYAAELGRAGPSQAALATRAAVFLAASGRRVLRLEDAGAAVNLLGRAEALLAEGDPLRSRLLIELGRALRASGDLERSEETLDQAVQLAASSGDRAGEAHARVLRAAVRVSRGASRETIGELRQEAERAIPILEAAGGEDGLVEAWRRIAWLNQLDLRMRDAEVALTRLLELAERAGDRSAQRSARGSLIEVLAEGPTPISEGIRRSEELLASVTEGSPEAILLGGTAATLYGAQGRFDEARAAIARTLAVLEQFGRQLETSFFDRLGTIELWAGDLEAAEKALRRGLRRAEEIGHQYSRAMLSASLSRILYEQGRYEEAWRATEASEELGAGRPGFSQALWRAIRAVLLARNGKLEAGEELARDAVARVGPESPESVGLIRIQLAEVLRLAGRTDEARGELEAALRQFELKEHVVFAADVRAKLDGLTRQR
jgi:class 3 adenylate cyclase/tetratricopeptide (TPR) repeat protein